MVTMVPGQGGTVSISVLPLTIPPLQDGEYSGAVGSGSLRFFFFSYMCRQHLRGRTSLLRQKAFTQGGGLVRVSDPRSEDDISDLVYSSQVKGAF